MGREDRVCGFTVGERIDVPVDKRVCLCGLMFRHRVHSRLSHGEKISYSCCNIVR